VASIGFALPLRLGGFLAGIESLLRSFELGELLGTDDYQSMHDHDAWLSVPGIASLVAAIRVAPIEPGMPAPSVLIVVPPFPRELRGFIATKFVGANSKRVGLTEAYRHVAESLDCRFFDANSTTSTSRVDGVHLDDDQHSAVGIDIVEVTRNLSPSLRRAAPGASITSQRHCSRQSGRLNLPGKTRWNAVEHDAPELPLAIRLSFDDPKVFQIHHFNSAA